MGEDFFLRLFRVILRVRLCLVVLLYVAISPSIDLGQTFCFFRVSLLTNSIVATKSSFMSLDAKCPITGSGLPACATQTASFDEPCCGSLSAFATSVGDCYSSSAPDCLNLEGELFSRVFHINPQARSLESYPPRTHKVK